MAQNEDWWAQDVQAASAPTPERRKAEAGATSEEVSADIAAATKPATIRKTGAEALSAEAKAELDQLKVQQAREAKAAGEAAGEKGRRKRLGDIENLLFNVNQARQNLGFFSTGVPGQLTQGLWASKAQDLAASLEGVASPTVLAALEAAKSQSKTGASGFGALSEKELSLLKASIASLRQSQSEDQLRQNLNRVERHYRRFMAYNEGLDPDQPEGAFFAGLAPRAEPREGVEPAPEGGKPRPGKYEPDPERAGLNATITGMIRAGRTAEQIKAWANEVEPGLGDRLQGVESNIAAFRQYGDAFVPSVDVETKFVPAEGAGKTAVEAMMTGPGAAATGFTDVYTSGTMDEMTGGAGSRAMMQYAQEQSPFMYGAGQLAGGIAQYATGAKLLGPLLSKYGVTKTAPMLGDIVQGGSYGAGSAEGGFSDRFVGGLTGGTVGTVGGVTARRLGDVTSGVLGGVRNRGAELLQKYRVPMTIGQIAGGGLKETEERLMGMPYVGTQIASRRNEALEGFNRAAFNEAVAPLGAKVDALGPEGVQAAQDLVENAYKRALDGVTLQVDQPMVRVLRGQPYAQMARIPRVGAELQDQIDSVIDDFVDMSTGAPVLTGENLQAAWRNIRQIRQSYKNDPLFGRRIAPALSKIEDAFTDAMQRQAPDNADLFLRANESYKRTSILGDTVDFAGDVFTPSQLNVRSRQTGRTFGGKAASARGDRPFFDLIRGGRQTLPSKVKDPGTAGQMVLPLTIGTLAGGAQYGAQAGGEEREAPNLATPITTAVLAGLAAATPYTRGAQKAMTNIALAPRPALLRAAGDVTRAATLPISRGVTPMAVDVSLGERVPQPNVPYVPDTFDTTGLAAVPAAPEPTGGYYDPETDTFVLSNGIRVRSDGTIVEGQ